MGSEGAASTRGPRCAGPGASAVAGALDHVSFFAEAGAKNGPRKPDAALLDHATTVHRPCTRVREPSTDDDREGCRGSRGAIEAAATRVTTGFGAVEHCLGKS